MTIEIVFLGQIIKFNSNDLRLLRQRGLTFDGIVINQLAFFVDQEFVEIPFYFIIVFSIQLFA